MKYLVFVISFFVVSDAFSSEEEKDEFAAFLSNCLVVQSWADMPVDPYGRDAVVETVEPVDDSDSDDVEFLYPLAEISIPARPVKKFIPTYIDATHPDCKKTAQMWHNNLVDYCKYGEGVEEVQAILTNCPELVYKMNHNNHSLLYLVVRHAKGDADEEKGEVFSGVSERLKIMGSIISVLRSSSLKLPFKLSSILSTACLHGHTDMALMLLDCGADINYVDADGDSNMYHAVCNEGHSYEMLKMLIAKGIDVKRFDLSSILSKACSSGSKGAALMLLDCGADINYVDADGNSNLHHAVYNNGYSYEMLKMLIEKGIDVNRFLNAINNYGNTPLNVLYSRLNYSQDQTDANALLQGLGARVNLKK